MTNELPALFIVGAQRSGTTWLQRLLLADHRFCGGQESHFFTTFGRVLRDFDRKASLPRPHGLAGYWNRDDFVAEIRSLWWRTMSPAADERPGAMFILEKTPDHALWMPEIVEVVPDARFVHLVRDSRAVTASLLRASREPWGRTWAPKSARRAALRWCAFVDAAEEAGEWLGERRFLRLRFEDLVTDTMGELARVLQFVGLPVDRSRLEDVARSLSIDRRGTSSASPIPLFGDLASRDRVEPEGFVGAGRVDSWREELGPLQRMLVRRITADRLRRLEYAP